MSESSESATPTPTPTPAATPGSEGAAGGQGGQATPPGGEQGGGAEAGAEGGAKSEGGKPAGDGDAPVVPEAYEFKLPEGMEGVQVDQAMGEAFTPVLKDLGLTQEQVNKLTEAYAKQVKEGSDKVRTDLEAQWTGRVKGWEEAARKHTEYGGEHFDANLDLARQTLDRYSTPELKALLAETGLGSHPDLIGAFVKIGKATAEDRPKSAAAGSGTAPTSIADRLFGKPA